MPVSREDALSVSEEDEEGSMAVGEAAGALLFAPILNDLRRAEIAN
eukprot:CAMPEP_0185581762 /NCGR_PEP_ID=MMETSP0434-20130131/18913_1 /TAXON_ID=626734 ORGANISM="Favella taraikaensis, Strain Fe Narragansett Bay" /NCGR_SAMPLE_ID=MMETSP0434 /ASSEMBLY_ACC=CAM_ASM_000379 /LENGTH=45 /DNA_ID= /DNA_START= /DNA_END= /DNA_ORIENTATION=